MAKAEFKNMIYNVKKSNLKEHSREITNQLREDELNKQAMTEFLQAEQLILDNEVKLGDVLKGMADTVDAIIDQTMTVYGHGVGVNNKISIVKSKLSGRDFPPFNPELTKLLRVFGQAHEILKVLINDHKKTENLELQYTHGMGPEKKEEAKTKEKGISYKTFMRVIDAFTDYSGNIKLHPREYEPDVDSIIAHIHEGTNHAEKRDLILNKLKATLIEIQSTYNQLLQQDGNIKLFYTELLKDKTLTPELRDLINGDGTGEKGSIGLLVELDGRKQAINNQLEVIRADVLKINQALGLEENMKRGFLNIMRAIAIFKKNKIPPAA